MFVWDPLEKRGKTKEGQGQDSLKVPAGQRMLGWEFQVCFYLAVWLWVSYLSSLGFSFLIKKNMGDSSCSTLLCKAIVRIQRPDGKLGVGGAMKDPTDVGKLFCTLFCFPNNLRNLAIDNQLC